MSKQIMLDIPYGIHLILKVKYKIRWCALNKVWWAKHSDLKSGLLPYVNFNTDIMDEYSYELYEKNGYKIKTATIKKSQYFWCDRYVSTSEEKLINFLENSKIVNLDLNYVKTREVKNIRVPNNLSDEEIIQYALDNNLASVIPELQRYSVNNEI